MAHWRIRALAGFALMPLIVPADILQLLVSHGALMFLWSLTQLRYTIFAW